MSKTVLLEDVKNPITSVDWQAKVNYLRQQARLAAKEAKKAERLEAIQLEEEQKKQRIADAFELIEFLKTRQLKNGASVYEWMTEELKKSKADAAQNSGERAPSGTENQTENGTGNGNNGQG